MSNPFEVSFTWEEGSETEAALDEIFADLTGPTEVRLAFPEPHAHLSGIYEVISVEEGDA